MKVAYFCYLTQLDTDLAYIQEAQQICDVTTYIYINRKHFGKSIIKLNKLHDESGVFDASIYPEFNFLKPLIDLRKVKIINISDEKHWELKAFNVFNILTKTLDKTYDVIHITSILQPSEFPLYRLRRKIIMTVHDPLPHSHAESLKHRIARNMAMKLICNFVIFNSAQAEIFVDTYKLQRKRVGVSRFGIFPWFRLLEASSKRENEETHTPYILFAGRISQYKGIDYLLPAMETIHENYPNVKLIIAGSGRLYFDISKWEKLPYIEFRNRFIPDNELIELIKNSLFIVCPYTDATQSGVVMSAFTFNKPVLATNVGGLPEMIVSNRHGIIVERKNIDALSRGIDYMLASPTLLNVFSRNIESDYSKGDRSWKKIAEEIYQMYRAISNPQI